ncbi:alpha/beta hydrolase family protein [Streptomyces varsoviensis]|uniref:Acetylhydrolase n=1 Tax=Streptomyces varsoviensis TaxID=67373 RepID=A0ABR5ITL6_9ACTN|nr:acetylhydrolase [Streptomyces varsoviensis]KOG64415.1 acetylhydrolase [Streptomyces varsoviensis]
MSEERTEQPTGTTRRTVLRSAGALAATGALLTSGVGRAQARPNPRDRAADITLNLPAPAGPYRTGVTTLYLVDRSRRDPWDPGIAVREVMVTVFYPARTVDGFPVARQMTEEAAAVFAQVAPLAHPQLPKSGVNWAATSTHSHTNAPARPVPSPVLLYSPGGGDPRTLGTSVAEELASHGYAVVTVDHPGDAAVVSFPTERKGRSGTFRTTVFRGDPREQPKLFRTMINTRVADLAFVLDHLRILTAGRLPEGLADALDLSRVGAYGHSAGGTAVSEAMYEDRRIAAAINLEGYLDQAPRPSGHPGPLYPIARHGTRRPLLLLGTPDFPHQKELSRSWSPLLTHPHNHTHHARLDNTAHWIFTDYAAIAPQLQSAALIPPPARTALIGTLPPPQSIPLIRNHIRAFFTRHVPIRPH